jgi:hypothetical protein
VEAEHQLSIRKPYPLSGMELLGYPFGIKVKQFRIKGTKASDKGALRKCW